MTENGNEGTLVNHLKSKTVGNWIYNKNEQKYCWVFKLTRILSRDIRKDQGLSGNLWQNGGKITKRRCKPKTEKRISLLDPGLWYLVKLKLNLRKQTIRTILWIQKKNQEILKYLPSNQKVNLWICVKKIKIKIKRQRKERKEPPRNLLLDYYCLFCFGADFYYELLPLWSNQLGLLF